MGKPPRFMVDGATVGCARARFAEPTTARPAIAATAHRVDRVMVCLSGTRNPDHRAIDALYAVASGAKGEFGAN